jgi:methanogenic corrinoid protein MtbC1
MDVQHELFETIRRADRTAANTLLSDWAAKHGYERLLADVVEPTLQTIGEEWCGSEGFSLAQAYVAATVAEDALIQIANARRSAAPPQPSKGPVVLGNIEDDFHALGRRMVCTFLRSDGWIIHDLGNDVPPTAFVDKALEVGARVIGVSAMMLTTALSIRRLREDIDHRVLTGKIQLAVGGAVFIVRPGLVEEVGGDGTARSAVDAPSLFTELWNRSLARETPP